MPPHPDNISSNGGTSQDHGEGKYKFIYKNAEYDCSSYAQKHPGGQIVFDRMLDEKKDFTEYFRTLHSKKAVKILKSFPKVNNKHPIEESIGSKRFSEMKRKLKPYFEPNFIIETLLAIVLATGLYLGVTDTCWFTAIPTLCLTQIVSGWVHHSTNHNRHPILWKYNQLYDMISGFSTQWWQFKHNNHHMFTNRIGKDDDINHQYQQWQFCFLFLKWKIDSILVAYKSPEMIFITIHWILILQQKIWIYVVAMLIAGWFSANILINNHERETKFFDKINLPFFEHQIAATRNYAWTDFFSMVLMGGMQYQTEHHLFPQIPFYKLPSASQIIRAELAKFGLKIKIDSIF